MKKLIYITFLPFTLFLFGCPVGMSYAPGKPGTEKIDQNILGTWETAYEDAEFGLASLTQKNAFSFQVHVDKIGSMYSLDEYDFEGWNTEVDGQKIVYIFSGNQYFMYGYALKQDGLHLFDISLLEGGVDAVTSTEAFRKEISASLKKEGCLAEEKLFVKK